MQSTMTSKLYDTDFYSWALHQADLLRNEEYADLDRGNLIEEIEDMAKSQHRELRSRLVVLLRHLFKLACLPNSAPSRGWRLTVKEQRYQIDELLQVNPSLRRFVPDLLSELYAQASDLAMNDLANDDLAGPEAPALSADCPWTAEQILDLSWWP